LKVFNIGVSCAFMMILFLCERKIWQFCLWRILELLGVRQTLSFVTLWRVLHMCIKIWELEWPKYPKMDSKCADSCFLRCIEIVNCLHILWMVIYYILMMGSHHKNSFDNLIDSRQYHGCNFPPINGKFVSSSQPYHILHQTNEICCFDEFLIF
jgi:hypothetical protein